MNCIILLILQIVETNLDFTNTPHTPLKRDGVLFLTQRRQATSDIRENPKVDDALGLMEFRYGSKLSFCVLFRYRYRKLDNR